MSATTYQLWLSSWLLIRPQLEQKLAQLDRDDVADFLDDLERNIADVSSLLHLDPAQAAAAHCKHCGMQLSLVELIHEMKLCLFCSTQKQQLKHAPTLSA